MYTIFETRKFCKSLKKITRSVGGKKIYEDLRACLLIIKSGTKLPENYKDHFLRGEYLGHRECHVRGDVLLVYKIEKEKMILVLVEIGSHSYLF